MERHNRLLSEDVTATLVEHVRSSIMYERQLLRELEALRPDVNICADKAPPKPNEIPRPMVIPPLDAPLIQKKAPLPPSSVTQSSFLSGGSPNVNPSAPLPPQSPGAGPSSSPALSATSFTPPVSPLSATSSEGPLGGKFGDGTRSMFVKPVSSPLAHSTPSLGSPTTGQQQAHDPLLSPNPKPNPSNHPLGRSVSVQGSYVTGPADGLDPLGQTRPTYLSASVRVVQPGRPRLDAREAASKLANMF
jgi:hypothetical protein